jgi:hypothetical protein
MPACSPESILLHLLTFISSALLPLQSMLQEVASGVCKNTLPAQTFAIPFAVRLTLPQTFQVTKNSIAALVKKIFATRTWHPHPQSARMPSKCKQMKACAAEKPMQREAPQKKKVS